jgi:thioester reductase-like protein
MNRGTTHGTDPAATRDGAVLLTGSTGFIGVELLARFMRRSRRRVYALVRAADGEEARERLRAVLRSATGSDSGLGDRVVPVRGDVEQPGLGIGSDERERIAEEVSDVLHAAASVSFTLPLERAREINVEGTRHALEFAEHCRSRGGFGRYSHVSTAYVAGTHSGEFREDQLDVGQGFHNTYEQTKFEAERLVRSQADGLAVQVFRPSIIVGDSETGWTSSFNVMYTPLKAFQRHTVYAVPARRSAPVDVVPVNYVADAIAELVDKPGEGSERTYHLVAGRRATTVGRLIDMAAGFFGKRKPPTLPTPLYMALIRPLILATSPPAKRKALRKNEAFVPYFSLQRRYDDTRARNRLAAEGIVAPPIEDYFDRLAEFAVRAEWGRRELPRSSAQR